VRPQALIVCATVAVVLVFVSAASAAQPLRTGMVDPVAFGGLDKSEIGTAYDRVRAAGATYVRMQITWASVAPASPPTDWHPSDPNDPAYNWTQADAAIAAIVQHGLVPIVAVAGTPSWAALVDSPASAPKAADYGAFALAAARRYSGRTPGLPHVKYWQAWVEPNLTPFFQPQFDGTQPVSPDIYRGMVNAFAASVHSVSPQNRVIAGGTAPFRDNTPSVEKVMTDWGPLTFMRQVLCLSKALEPTCSTRVHFDIWDHHPYTSGGPSHHAAFPDDVSLGDLGKMRATLQAAARAGHLVSRGPVGFWVTEFSWDSSPPDPKGVPMPLLTRWVAEGLYTMWRNGITLVAWLQLRDDPLAQSFLQSGLYYRGSSLASDSRKPLLRAFRFPFVAYPSSPGIKVWGRTPTSKGDGVAVEARIAGRWRAIGRLAAAANGMFQATLAVGGTADLVRARDISTGDVAAAFSLKAPPDHFYNPFGQPTLLEPRSKKR
jgi:hypothetical protein